MGVVIDPSFEIEGNRELMVDAQFLRGVGVPDSQLSRVLFLELCSQKPNLGRRRRVGIARGCIAAILSFVSPILEQTSHRPWPLPERSWVMHMSWEHLAFLHWRVDAGAIQRQLPEGLELDCFDGSAWLGVVPFLMNRVHARWLPEIPPTHRFLELNLRTYVVCDGKPGVWFFSLDASSRLAVWGARTFFHLPYFNAEMEGSFEPRVEYRSRRTHKGAVAGEFEAVYEPTGETFRSEAGSLEHWLTERYCLYAANEAGNLGRGEVQHAPWPLQPARVEIATNTLGDLAGVKLEGVPESVLFARRLDVLGWTLSDCG